MSCTTDKTSTHVEIRTNGTINIVHGRSVHRWIWVFTEATATDFIRSLLRFSADPQNDFTASDAAIVACEFVKVWHKHCGGHSIT